MIERPKDSENADLEEIARHPQTGRDVSEHFSGRFEATQHVNVGFPVRLLREIDAECTRTSVPRQTWIKMVCDERLRPAREDEARGDS